MPPHPRVPQPAPDTLIPVKSDKRVWSEYQHYVGPKGTTPDTLIPDFAAETHKAVDPKATEELLRRMFALGMRYTSESVTGGVSPLTHEKIEEEATLIENGGQP